MSVCVTKIRDTTEYDDDDDDDDDDDTVDVMNGVMYSTYLPTYLPHLDDPYNGFLL